MAGSNRGQNYSDKKRIENLEEKLYSRVERPETEQKNTLIRRESTDIPSDWNDKDDFNLYDGYSATETESISKVTKWILWLSLFFFIIAVGVGAYVYFRGTNIVSSDNINITVAGPIAIGAGQELDLVVTVQNQNNIDLSDATLNVDYPNGTQNPKNVSSAELHESDDLGPIPAGGSASHSISAVFFGELNSEKDINLTVDYEAKNSNATFQKIKTIPVDINSVPVAINVTSLKEIDSGQDLEFDVDVASNSQTPLYNLLLQTDYGFGWSYESSSPSPMSNSNDSVWQIGTLNPGQHTEIKIKGKLQGQDGEDQAFHFTVGTQSQQNNIAISPVFLSVTQTVSIQKPFMGIDLALDGSTGSPFITSAGQNMRGDLNWINNSPNKITNAEITMSLSGVVLDKTSVQAGQGFYDSAANTITWNQTTNSELALVSPGDTGDLSFNFGSLVPQIGTLSNFHKAEIDISINVSGQQTDATGVSSQEISTVTRKIYLDTDLAVVPTITYTDGPFANTGPFPMRAEKPTTLTVNLAVTDSFNDASGVKVTAALPTYVKWLGVVSPSSEQVDYSSSTGVVEWDPGNISSGTGFSVSPKQVSFQVSFTPSVSQVGTVPVLLNNIDVIGTDSFTNDSLSSTYQSLSSNLNTDSTYQLGSGVILPPSQQSGQ